jgi:hypothetical protein
MSGRAKPRNATGHRAAIPAGIAVGIAITLATFAAGGGGLLSHTVCSVGAPVANELFWTPFNLVNAPYLGSTYYQSSFDTWELYGPTHVRVQGWLLGGNLSTGYFETQNWSVFSQANQFSLGPGPNHPCTTSYKVGLAPSSFTVSYSGIPLQGPGNTSNTNEPTTFHGNGTNSSHFPAAVFANGFLESNSPSISTCGKPGQSLNYSSTSSDVSITVATAHGSTPVVFSVPPLENYTYYFPSNLGTWQVDNLQQNTALRGPGLAFSWTGC